MSASLRDRFFTPKVARSITDAPAIVAVGTGAAIGILIGLGPIGAVVGGAAFLAGRVGWAIPRREPGTREIDPFVLAEPWRRLVQDAVAAQRQFADTVRRAREGPLREELSSIGTRIEESVMECWRVARSGDALSSARSRIDVFGAQRELAEVQNAGYSSDTIAGTVTALEAQLATAARMDSTIAGTRDQLRLLNARLDEAVSRSIELSASSAGVDQLHTLGEDVSSIVDEMEALRQALEVVDTAGATPDVDGLPDTDPGPATGSATG